MPVRQKENDEERGDEQGLFLWIIGKTVRYAYKPMQTPIQAVTTLKMVRWTPNKYTDRPAKKRKRERWSSAGISSIVKGMRSSWTPCI